MRIRCVLLAGLSVLARPLVAQSPDAAVRGLVDGPKFTQAAAFIRSDQERFVRELVALTEIPAPPFKEQARAQAYMKMLREHGLADVEMDAEGNVMGIRRGTAPAGGPMLLVNAHLDTVFPEGTDVKVKRQGTRLSAPGIGDDTRGLAVILALLRTLEAAKFTTPGDILFAGNVGEEGEGDLRGMKFLMQKGRYKDRITQVLAIDGNDTADITRGGVGSKRYRVAFKGPGGHSYGAFGLVNPAFAMGGAIAKFSHLEVPATPKTTYSVGVVRGGTSINAIPSEVSMDVDLRSESCAELKKIDDAFLRIVREAVDEENRTRSTREGRIEADPKTIGERPCGATALDAPIVQAASAAVRAFGLTPGYTISSTDANVPMSLGIPAVTIGRGGPGGRSHSPDEWADVAPEANAKNVQVVLAILLAVANGR
ncbi:MAG TPA: M20/M25/M40 family metallo-hydrolase [Vicinamibacterales bacterium]|nr:M20/M25/M40 family metallo-hydrolase [Vicinamibacterales bacterium]